MNSMMEVSDTQAAAALLGMNAGICSDIFSSFDARSYEEYIATEKNNLNDFGDSTSISSARTSSLKREVRHHS